MCRLVFVCLSCLLLISCTPTETGRQIVEKSVQTHGGWENFERLSKVHFIKTTQLYQPNGTLQSNIEQRQEFQLQPTYFVRISQQQEDGRQRIVFYDRLNAEVFDDSVEVKSVSDINAAKQLGKSAAYVFFQPFDIYKSNAQLTALGTTKLFDSIRLKEVKVDYPGQQASDDQWSYFFDDEYRCRAAMVRHNDRRSLIVTTHFQAYEGLLFQQSRKSYFVDSLRNLEYMRASYEYTIIPNETP
jgi:hypothetical protein